MNHSHLRGIVATAARALVLAGLIVFALRDVDFGMLLEHLRNAEQGAVTLAALVTVAISVLHARRWEVVLGRSGLPGGILWLLSQRRKPQAVPPTGQPGGTR